MVLVLESWILYILVGIFIFCDFLLRLIDLDWFFLERKFNVSGEFGVLIRMMLFEDVG